MEIYYGVLGASVPDSLVIKWHFCFVFDGIINETFVSDMAIGLSGLFQGS